jgi:SAM-dependent methyltransferase
LLFVATNGYAETENKKDESYTPVSGQEGKDVIWVPTQHKLVDTMLAMAKVTSSDYVIDLGSGDGRLVIAAAKRGATALGIEYNPDMVALARRTATTEGVDAKARFEKADIFESDFSKATVITMFLLPELNLKLRPKILDMKPGTRIVSNSFDMGDWDADQTIRLSEPEYTADYATARLWIVPAKVDGLWRFGDAMIRFTQHYQKISGTLVIGKQETALTGKLDGENISFEAGNTKYTGTVNGNTISGTCTCGIPWKITRLK